MSPDRVAATLAAGLTADPPEIRVARDLVAYYTAHRIPRVTVDIDLLRELLASVDYLRAELARARSRTGGER